MGNKYGSVNDLQWLAQIDKDFRISLDAGGNPQYIGFAMPGTTETTAKWQIQKLTYDGSFTTQVIKGVYADGTDDYIKQWSLRATYTYI